MAHGHQAQRTEREPHDPRKTLATACGDLLALCTDTLGELEQRYFPGWRIPGFFAGHPVQPDVAADVAFTLAHLHDLGVEEVSGTAVPDAIAALLGDIDAERTHTFFSYRVAETLARFGPFADNQLVSHWPRPARDNLLRAIDSTDWIELLEEYLPRNYAAVLARCEMARRSLGVPVDEAVLAELIARTTTMLGRDPLCRLDDSTHGVGRVDIYTVDVWLFTEEFAGELGALWPIGVREAVSLVERVGGTSGAAIPWGRSSGALASALTLELAALVLSSRHTHPEWTERVELWETRFADAANEMPSWFDSGLTTAHQHRNTYDYRGPFRRLQMTADLLGKVAWALRALQVPSAEAAVGAGSQPGAAVGAHPGVFDHDELIPLTSDPPAYVWSYCDGPSGFVVPFVGGTRSDYLAAPRRPGTWEVPVDSEIACWIPAVSARHKRFAPCGVPRSISHRPGTVSAEWDGLAALGELDPRADADRLGGHAVVQYRVEGRTLAVSIALQLEAPVEAVAVTLCEASARPLRVEFDVPRHQGSTPSASPVLIDTSGIAQWRSFWGELPVVHEVELDPTPEDPSRYELTYRVTPTIRVASTAHGHHYDDSLYGPLGEQRRAVSLPNPLGPMGTPGSDLRAVDVFHLHWPEWLAFDDLAEHRRIAGQLGDAGVPVLWTAHNLTPHEKRPEAYEDIYRLWARHAAAVIHHSSWGEQRMRSRYDFADSTTHHVVPHGHFGHLYPSASVPRSEAARRLGLPDAPIRIGLLGAPRSERDVAGFLDAVKACANQNIQVCCWSLAPGEDAPGDARIAVAEPYRMVDTSLYGLRLAACDVIAMPFDAHGEMLATGVAADAVGYSKAALVSPWEYLGEVLGNAGIPMGSSVEQMTDALDRLDATTVSSAARATGALRDSQSWSVAAELTAGILEGLLSEAGRRR